MAAPYAPTLGDLQYYITPSQQETSGVIDMSKAMELATKMAERKMVQNEAQRIEHKKDLEEAYSKLDPSKLKDTLPEDQGMLLEKMHKTFEILANHPEAISNPKSPYFKEYQDSHLDWSTSAYKSNLRKLTADKNKSLIDSNPDYNTTENQSLLSEFKNNFDADPSRYIPVPKINSALPYFADVAKNTGKEYESLEDNGDGTLVKKKGVKYDNYLDSLENMFYEGKYINGNPIGLQWQKDVYDNPNSEQGKALKDKFGDVEGSAFRAWMWLGDKAKPNTSIISIDASENKDLETYKKKQNIEATANVNEEAGKKKVNYDYWVKEEKYKAEHADEAKIDSSSLNAMYEAESKSINDDDNLSANEKSMKLKRLSQDIYGKVYKAFASVENGGKLTPNDHSGNDKDGKTAFGVFGWIKDKGHLRQAFNSKAVGSEYSSYEDFWKALHKGGDVYTKTLKEYVDFLSGYTKQETGVDNVNMADLLAFNLYGANGVKAYRSGNLDYKVGDNMTVGSYVNKALSNIQMGQGAVNEIDKYGSVITIKGKSGKTLKIVK